MPSRDVLVGASHDVDLVFLDFFNLLEPLQDFIQFRDGCSSVMVHAQRF